MADEPDDTEDDDDDLGEMETDPPSDAEWVDADDASYCFPDGSGEFALRFDVPCFRVLTRKAGAVEVLRLREDGSVVGWMDVTKLKRGADLRAIKRDETKGN